MCEELMQKAAAIMPTNTITATTATALFKRQ